MSDTIEIKASPFMKLNLSPEANEDFLLLARMNEFRNKIASHNMREICRYEDERILLGDEKARKPELIPMGYDDDDEGDYE